MSDINKMRESTLSGFILLDYLIILVSTEFIIDVFKVHKFIALIIFYTILYSIHLITT
jgi:hypothetical protein